MFEKIRELLSKAKELAEGVDKKVVIGISITASVIALIAIMKKGGSSDSKDKKRISHLEGKLETYKELFNKKEG